MLITLILDSLKTRNHNHINMRRLFLLPFFLFSFWFLQTASAQAKDFAIKGFHLDLRIQVMKMDALKKFAKTLSEDGINTLVMEWEGTFPFEKHPLNILIGMRIRKMRSNPSSTIAEYLASM